MSLCSLRHGPKLNIVHSPWPLQRRRCRLWRRSRDRSLLFKTICSSTLCLRLPSFYLPQSHPLLPPLDPLVLVTLPSSPLRPRSPVESSLFLRDRRHSPHHTSPSFQQLHPPRCLITPRVWGPHQTSQYTLIKPRVHQSTSPPSLRYRLKSRLRVRSSSISLSSPCSWRKRKILRILMSWIQSIYRPLPALQIILQVL